MSLFSYTYEASGNNIATLTPDKFENSMETSFIYWLQNSLQNVEVEVWKNGAITIHNVPIKVFNCMPFEAYEKQRDRYALLDVNFKYISHKGFHLGTSLGNENTLTNGRFLDRAMPWVYFVTVTINTYASSSVVRSKLDGMLRYLLEGTQRGSMDCPVYQWQADTTGVSAFTTGASISLENIGNTFHDSDKNNTDFLSHWEFSVKCPYIIDSFTSLVSSFDLTTNVLNLPEE